MSLTYEELRTKLDRMSDVIDDWQGLPVPLGPETPLVLNTRHELREFYDEQRTRNPGLDIIVGGPPSNGRPETLRNSWFSRQRNATVYVYERDGKCFAALKPRSPDGSMDRLTLWIGTLGASDAWDVEAEYKARKLLKSMLTERQWRHYDLTGSFLETSDRSRLSYMFRRLRPTIVLSPRHKGGDWDDNIRCIAVLCLHPIGYYDTTWAGCLTPTDDVIAHLTFMRGDEAKFWSAANKHAAHEPEAGI